MILSCTTCELRNSSNLFIKTKKTTSIDNGFEDPLMNLHGPRESADHYTIKEFLTDCFEYFSLNSFKNYT